MFYFGLFHVLGLSLFGLLALPFSIVFFSVLSLNHFGQNKLSRAIVVINFTSVIYIFSSTLGRDAGVHFWFVPAMVVPFLLFSLDEKKYLLPSAIGPLSVFMFLWFSKFKYSVVHFAPISSDQVHLLSIFMIVGGFSTAFGIVLFLISEYEKMFRMKLSAVHAMENYSMALDASSIVAFTDVSGTITFANDKFCEISGYSKNELLGKNHFILSSGHHSKAFFVGLWKTISSNQVWKGEICNKAKDGHLYWVDTTIVPKTGVDGKIEQYIAIRHDITQRKLAEQLSLQSAKMASLGEMAGGIAHEINNPLAIIQGKSQQLIRTIQRGKFTPEYGSEELSKIVKTSERIAKIVRGLRAFSRNAEKDPFLSFELKALFDDVLGLCSEKFKAHQIKLEISSTPSIFLQCRPVQLEQVLLNLLNNAHDAVLPLADKWIRIDSKILDGKVLISVTDSGCGIPPEITNKLMQPFFTTKAVGKGTGLGLSISKGILEDHHGHLRYDASSPNTRFEIELPLKQNSDKTIVSATSEKSAEDH